MTGNTMTKRDLGSTGEWLMQAIEKRYPEAASFDGNQAHVTRAPEYAALRKLVELHRQRIEPMHGYDLQVCDADRVECPCPTIRAVSEIFNSPCAVAR